jgi:hypothetical protein
MTVAPQQSIFNAAAGVVRYESDVYITQRQTFQPHRQLECEHRHMPVGF